MLNIRIFNYLRLIKLFSFFLVLMLFNQKKYGLFMFISEINLSENNELTYFLITRIITTAPSYIIIYYENLFLDKKFVYIVNNQLKKRVIPSLP